MGQDSHWLQDIENISPAHHWYRSYGCWFSRPRVRPWSWTRLLLVKREIWTWNCCCVRVCVLFFSSSHLSLKETPTKCHSFWKSPTPRSWFCEIPNWPLFQWSALPEDLHFNKMAAMRRCPHCRVRDHYFLFVSDSLGFFFILFLIFFFTITNTKDPVEKTLFHWQQEYNICFCKKKKKLPLFNQTHQASLEFSETNWLLCFHTPLRREEWKDSPNRQNSISLYHVSGVDE